MHNNKKLINFGIFFVALTLFLGLGFFVLKASNTNIFQNPASSNVRSVSNPIISHTDVKNWHTTLNPLNLQLVAISCTKSDVCYGLDQDNNVFSTPDWGSSWDKLNVPIPVNKNQKLERINCPEVDVCYVAGYEASNIPPYFSVIASTSNNGNSWVISKRQSSTIPMVNDLTCPTVVSCFLIADRVVLTTNDSAKTWTSKIISAFPKSIACPTKQLCILVGGAWGMHESTGIILVTLDNGITWLDKTFDSHFPLTSISCANSSTCWATGGMWNGAVLTTSDSGNTWTNPVYLKADFDIVGIFPILCSTDKACFSRATGGRNIIYTLDGGKNWLVESMDNKILRSISCNPSGKCIGITDSQVIINN